MNSGCSASSGSAGQTGSAASSASCHQTSRPSRSSHGSPVCCTTMIVSRCERWPISRSTSLFTGAVLPLRRAPSAVISALALENAIRSCTDSALKPPKTTLCGAPIRVHASIATITSGIIGR